MNCLSEPKTMPEQWWKPFKPLENGDLEEAIIVDWILKSVRVSTGHVNVYTFFKEISIVNFEQVIASGISNNC